MSIINIAHLFEMSNANFAHYMNLSYWSKALKHISATVKKLTFYDNDVIKHRQLELYDNSYLKDRNTTHKLYFFRRRNFST